MLIPNVNSTLSHPTTRESAKMSCKIHSQWLVFWRQILSQISTPIYTFAHPWNHDNDTLFFNQKSKTPIRSLQNQKFLLTPTLDLPHHPNSNNIIRYKYSNSYRNFYLQLLYHTYGTYSFGFPYSINASFNFIKSNYLPLDTLWFKL